MSKPEEFDEGIRKIVEKVEVRPRNSKLEGLALQLRSKLDALGRAIYKLEVVRKDPGAAPEVVSNAAQLRRALEAEANNVMGQYVSEVIRNEKGEGE